MNLHTIPGGASVQPAIEARSLGRSYRAARGAPARRALDSITLTIHAREWVALLGPNGSGKSTLLRILATIDTPDAPDAAEGGLRVLGLGLPAGARAVRAKLGVVFQKPGLDATLTVRENLALQAALFGLDRSTMRRRIGEVAAQLGVADRLSDRVGSLSGGLARRVDLARALLCEPDLLLLDEPTTGLDLDARIAFLATLDAARAARPSMTIVMTTHLMDEAERAQRVVMLSEGRIVADEAPSALRASLGARTVRAPGEWAEALERAGLEVRRDRSGLAVVGAGGAAQVRAAVDALVDAGASFDVGPATLADVYLALTGRGLEQTQGSAS